MQFNTYRKNMPIKLLDGKRAYTQHNNLPDQYNLGFFKPNIAQPCDLSQAMRFNGIFVCNIVSTDNSRFTLLQDMFEPCTGQQVVLCSALIRCLVDMGLEIVVYYGMYTTCDSQQIEYPDELLEKINVQGENRSVYSVGCGQMQISGRCSK